MAQLIDEVTSEVDENPQQEAVSEEVAVDDTPEHYRGKTPAELIKMHQEAESRIGQQGQEVGQLRKVVDDLYYANMSYGYDKPQEDRMYEEAMGLDEYNTNTSYTNPITRVDKKYDKVCKYRADAYGKEFARRKPKLNFPEQDTRYDKDIFILDLKDGLGDAYLERIWSDDYEVLPTGVFSPETATNLRLTPYRNSQRHEWFYGSGLVKFPEKYVRFANSIGNSELVTKKVGEVARAENGNNQINTLQYPKFSNQWIEFEYPVDYFVNEMIYGTTEINGRQVPNYYCKLEFINNVIFCELDN